VFVSAAPRQEIVISDCRIYFVMASKDVTPKLKDIRNATTTLFKCLDERI